MDNRHFRRVSGRFDRERIKGSTIRSCEMWRRKYAAFDAKEQHARFAVLLNQSE